jgi:UDP-glucose 4-epimerase
VERNGILLIGGNGFLGRALVARLRAQGGRAYVLARRRARDLPPDVSVHEGGMENQAALREVLPRCRSVIHLASTTTPSLSADRPLLEIEENVLPTMRFLAVLQEFPGIHLIYLSTGGALYGNSEGRAASENDPIAPLSYHGAGKAALEALLQAYAGRTGTALTVLRPSNLYGPGQPLRAGFGIIRTMLEHARNGTTLQIWGDGEQVRDFLFIDDMVDVCQRFIELPDDRGTYNVGSGEGHTLNQIRAIVERESRRPLAVTYGPGRAGDVRSVVLDTMRVRGRLQWAPQVSLECGIRASWAWISASGGLGAERPQNE